ncbi:hypothetical protein ANOM_011104 [Aspergillus nomiae NRRL 13137]|uniref:DUF7703 domain-containing protein n=1 Tax=Aspergillus nomiae NRRL (strain ATCC 15546 / NRRL 13137 / CBS 260.88 / M93) TaxID=1509407 RepID=A0A0L1IN91_ASPN3|nr:uncharacterized protein ANOM_011104 [Aspergillus nomiae NRRL 13137]KNG80947.1 hypothetical protein ANOM_011104 [Aspergillus nomiae NRRL 13137]
MDTTSNEAAIRLQPLGGHGTFTIKTTSAAFLAIALYNAVELLILILGNFHHHHGIYFWSLLLSTAVGVVPFSIGAIIDLYNLSPLWVILVMIDLGWIFMVGGQSVVLYSRLHLVSRNDRVLRYLRYIIIIDTLILATPMSVIYFTTAYAKPRVWARAFYIMEVIQVIWFSVQECVISAFWIVETARLIRLRPGHDRRRKRTMYEILAINLAAILMDIALLVLQFSGYYYVQVPVKATVYSIKLKLEFAVLGKLVHLATAQHTDSMGLGGSPVMTPVDVAASSSPSSDASKVHRSMKIPGEFWKPTPKHNAASGAPM